MRVYINDASTSGSARALRRRLLATRTPSAPPTAPRPPPPRQPLRPPPGSASPLGLVGKSVPARMASHPAYLAALEGAALAGEPGEGLTPAQAAAADASWATNNPRPGSVTAAAAPGTFVYWLYGGGLADSGDDVGIVLSDEVVVSGRWVLLFGCLGCSVGLEGVVGPLLHPILS